MKESLFNGNAKIVRSLIKFASNDILPTILTGYCTDQPVEKGCSTILISFLASNPPRSFLLSLHVSVHDQSTSLQGDPVLIRKSESTPITSANSFESPYNDLPCSTTASCLLPSQISSIDYPFPPPPHEPSYCVPQWWNLVVKNVSKKEHLQC